MKRSYRFSFFPLGFLTGLFNPTELAAAIAKGAKDGYRMVRREFTLEPRRILFFLGAPSFGMIFQKDENNPEPEYDWKVVMYKTRFFTKTVDPKAMANIINTAAQGGYELFFSMKYPCRFLFFFPREAYFFVLRKPTTGATANYTYSIHLTPYRFFSRTLDPAAYETDLNNHGAASQLKITFRDERRKLIFIQPTVVSIWEQAA